MYSGFDIKRLRHGQIFKIVSLLNRGGLSSFSEDCGGRGSDP
jgi:hypothetical protein